MAFPVQYDPVQLEAVIESRIQERLTSAMQQTAAGNTAVLENLKSEAGACINQCQASVSECNDKIDQLAAAAADSEKRMASRIDEINLLAAEAKNAYTRTGLLEQGVQQLHDGMVQLNVDWSSKIQVLEEEFDVNVANRSAAFTAQFDELKAKMIKNFEVLRQELYTWSKSVEDKFGSLGGPPGLGERYSTSGRSKLDKKELSVWRLEDNVEKLKFRHWVEAIENNLEQVQGWDRASEILDRVRRQEREID